MSITIENFDPVLTNLSVMYRNQDFVADIVSPRLPVASASGKYPVFGKESFNINTTAPIKGMATAEETDHSVTTETFTTKRYGEREPVPDDDIREGEKLGLNPLEDAAENIADTAKRKREKRIADLFYTGTHYQALAAYNADSNPTYVFLDDYTNSNPFVIIGKLKKQFQLNCGKMPSHIIMNPDVQEILSNHPKRDTKSSQSQDRVSNNELPEIFMNMKVLLAGTTYNNAKKGRTENIDYVWGNNIFLVYVDPSPGKRKVSASYTFDLMGGYKTETYRESPAKKGYYVEINEWVDEKIVCDPCIFVIRSVLLAPIGT